MNQDHSSTWSQTLHHDPMLVTSGDDEFANFLDLGISFPNFENLENGQTGFGTPMGDLGMDQLVMDGSMAAPGEDMQYDMNSVSQAPSAGAMHASGQDVIAAYHDQSLSQHHSHMLANPNRQHQIIIPPTPQSAQMQGATARYHQHMNAHRQKSYDRNQAPFTPLVSPVMTPLDASFHIPEYAVPGEYFTPLTSPAIEAQNSQVRRSLYTSAPSSDIAALASPTGFNLEHTSATSSPATSARKSRRKPSMSTRTSSRSVRQSPIVKAQERRKQNSMSYPSTPLANLAESNQAPTITQATNALQRTISSSDGSGPDSVSPEPLSESLMPPPAIPRSSGKPGKSPILLGRSNNPVSPNEPATPATLMRLAKDQARMVQPMLDFKEPKKVGSPNVIEDIILPEAAAKSTSRPILHPIDTRRTDNDDQTTPTLSAKTPKLAAGDTPRGLALSPAAVDASNNTPHKGVESKSGARSSKKRQSNPPTQVSPALRPKISPSIKPLIPISGVGLPALSAETTALYLASKSNYQNILEGTHLPGVTYPEALTENLSSKRTSHKIAEQGRRNRINTALKEIETLLPAIPGLNGKKERTGSNEGECAEKGSSANQSNSKASTVEMAIVYIKALHAELSATKAKLETAERKLAENDYSSSSQTPD